MPLMKNNKLSQEIQELYSDKKQITGFLTDTVEHFKTKSVCKFLQSYKSKGFDCSDLFYNLLLCGYYNITNIWKMTGSRYFNTKSGKDSFYRLKNNSNIDWRCLLYMFVKIFFSLVSSRRNDNRFGESVLILDDTDLPKSGRKIENIGKVFSHVLQKPILGFKGLVLGYWDQTTFLPLDFSLHNEKGKNPSKPYGMPKAKLKLRFKKKRSKKQAGYKRVQELNKSKISNAITMIKRASKQGFWASYVLCDSWFMCSELILAVRSIKKGATHILGAVRMDKRRYKFADGKLYNAKQLLEKLKLQKQKSYDLPATYIETTVEYEGMKVKLFFSKFRNDKKWTLLLTTNCNISYEEAVKIYTMRWTIEVFFRESKQLFNLGKSYSSDFDGQIADITISMMQYIVLSLHKRVNYYESMYELFQEQSDLNKEMVVAEKIWKLFLSLLIKIGEELKINFRDLFKAFSKVLTENTTLETKNILQDFKKNYTKTQIDIIKYKSA